MTLRNWVKQAERDEGKRPDGLSTDEREELARLRRENQTLRMEREILKKAAAFSPGTPASRRRDLRADLGRRANFPVAVMCRALGVNRTSFHDWSAARGLTERCLTRG